MPSNKEGCVDAAIGRDVNNRTRMSVIKNNSTNRKSRVAISKYVFYLSYCVSKPLAHFSLS